MNMRFWQNWLNSDSIFNVRKNYMACIENDCACKTNEQLLQMLKQAQEHHVVQGIKKVLMARGFSINDLPQ